MNSNVMIGDIWEGKSSKNADWSTSLRFQVDSIKSKTAFLHSVPEGDVTKVGIDFATMNDVWRLVKRRGHKTFCEDCNPSCD